MSHRSVMNDTKNNEPRLDPCKIPELSTKKFGLKHKYCTYCFFPTT